MKISNLILLNCLLSVLSFGQPAFQYKREVIPGNTTSDWQRIDLPPDIFRHLKEDFSDIRIYHIEREDTIEVPYLLKVLHATVSESSYSLPVLNQSKKEGKLFLTFEMPADKKTNFLELNFQEENYNAYATIEGADNKQEWFMVAERERILNIRTSVTQFASNAISFPTINCKYLRLSIESDKALTFNSASFKELTSVPGEQKELAHTVQPVEQNRSKQTVWTATLQHLQPVNTVSLQINTTGDYYRPVSIEALTDSISTEKGWIYNYRILTHGYVTSVQENTFSFEPTLARKIRVVISNYDSPALDIESVLILGPSVALFVPGSVNKRLEMFYGDANMYAPQYDLVHFQNKVPDIVPTMELGSEIFIGQPKDKTAPLFENPIWLWAVMILVIGVLGFFTVKMMKAKA